MKVWGSAALVGLSLISFVARAETKIDAGSWVQTEKRVVEGAGSVSEDTRPAICLKGGDATLEKLLMPPAEDMAAAKCTGGVAAVDGGNAKLTMMCPASHVPAINSAASITYTPSSYEGTGTTEFTTMDGRRQSVKVTLSGKRAGDC